MAILGTRPEIIRLCRIIDKLNGFCQLILVHTGQNYDTNLNGIFFDQLKVRAPDYYLGATGSFGEQIGTILAQCEKIMQSEKPEKFLVLGDTNSSLAAVMAKRLAIPVYHMEAGNRCYDDRVPEEVNRRIIDHCSDVLMPYTERSRQNLLREGIAGERVFVTGNPIYEVIQYYLPQIDQSNILTELSLTEGNYFLVTLHRAENVDSEARLRQFAQAFDLLQKKYSLPIIISTHPHTRNKLASFGISLTNPDIHFLEPFGFFDFISLEKKALCVLSDSGTVQEECAIFKVPTVTLRDVTERPETLECGSNILSGADPTDILRCLDLVLSSPRDWNPPAEYLEKNVSQTVIKILTGFRLS